MATARKIAVIRHGIWRDGVEFTWKKAPLTLQIAYLPEDRAGLASSGTQGRLISRKAVEVAQPHQPRE